MTNRDGLYSLRSENKTTWLYARLAALAGCVASLCFVLRWATNADSSSRFLSSLLITWSIGAGYSLISVSWWLAAGRTRYECGQDCLRICRGDRVLREIRCDDIVEISATAHLTWTQVATSYGWAGLPIFWLETKSERGLSQRLPSLAIWGEHQLDEKLVELNAVIHRRHEAVESKPADG
ncbi:hypothetical protein ABIE44_003231 [Marmoricola sp. OAE513]|uniref:hypothetical protein n=1 Tax=Marmoricola sp. OAE513 TaxID=2817894 RepID=UPI001AEB705E